MRYGRSTALLAALAGVSAMALPPTVMRAASETQARSPVNNGKSAPAATLLERLALINSRRLIRGASGLTGKDFRRAGPGWSNKHVQRMALKKRNQAKHRKACRG